MADLLQGSALPDVNTTTTQTTTAPDFYTNYLSNLAQAGTTATTTAATDPSKLVAGFSDLQQQGFGALPGAATAAQPYLGAAGEALTKAGGLSAVGASQPGITAAGQTSVSNIQDYMNPFTSNVVDEMARLSQQNVQRNILPSLKAGFAGSGAFGSSRQANATGQTLADIQSGLTGQQSGALQAGYTQAMTASAADKARQLQAAVASGQMTSADAAAALAQAKEQESLGTTAQTTSLAGADAMLKGGAQQQALEQSRLEAPLKQATNAAALLRGFTIPTSTTSKFTGPIPGAYSASPLQQITGLGALVGSGLSSTTSTAGTTTPGWLSTLMSKLGSYSPTVTSPSGASTTPSQTYDWTQAQMDAGYAGTDTAPTMTPEEIDAYIQSLYQ